MISNANQRWYVICLFALFLLTSCGNSFYEALIIPEKKFHTKGDYPSSREPLLQMTNSSIELSPEQLVFEYDGPPIINEIFAVGYYVLGNEGKTIIRLSFGEAEDVQRNASLTLSVSEASMKEAGLGIPFGQTLIIPSPPGRNVALDIAGLTRIEPDMFARTSDGLPSIQIQQNGKWRKSADRETDEGIENSESDSLFRDGAFFGKGRLAYFENLKNGNYSNEERIEEIARTLALTMPGRGEVFHDSIAFLTQWQPDEKSPISFLHLLLLSRSDGLSDLQDAEETVSIPYVPWGAKTATPWMRKLATLEVLRYCGTDARLVRGFLDRNGDGRLTVSEYGWWLQFREGNKWQLFQNNELFASRLAAGDASHSSFVMGETLPLPLEYSGLRIVGLQQSESPELPSKMFFKMGQYERFQDGIWHPSIEQRFSTSADSSVGDETMEISLLFQPMRRLAIPAPNGWLPDGFEIYDGRTILSGEGFKHSGYHNLTFRKLSVAEGVPDNVSITNQASEGVRIQISDNAQHFPHLAIIQNDSEGIVVILYSKDENGNDRDILAGNIINREKNEEIVTEIAWTLLHFLQRKTVHQEQNRTSWKKFQDNNLFYPLLKGSLSESGEEYFYSALAVIVQKIGIPTRFCVGGIPTHPTKHYWIEFSRLNTEGDLEWRPFILLRNSREVMLFSKEAGDTEELYLRSDMNADIPPVPLSIPEKTPTASASLTVLIPNDQVQNWRDFRYATFGVYEWLDGKDWSWRKLGALTAPSPLQYSLNEIKGIMEFPYIAESMDAVFPKFAGYSTALENVDGIIDSNLNLKTSDINQGARLYPDQFIASTTNGPRIRFNLTFSPLYNEDRGFEIKDNQHHLSKKNLEELLSDNHQYEEYNWTTPPKLADQAAEGESRHKSFKMFYEQWHERLTGRKYNEPDSGKKDKTDTQPIEAMDRLQIYREIAEWLRFNFDAARREVGYANKRDNLKDGIYSYGVIERNPTFEILGGLPNNRVGEGYYANTVLIDLIRSFSLSGHIAQDPMRLAVGVQGKRDAQNSSEMSTAVVYDLSRRDNWVQIYINGLWHNLDAHPYSYENRAEIIPPDFRGKWYREFLNAYYEGLLLSSIQDLFEENDAWQRFGVAEREGRYEDALAEAFFLGYLDILWKGFSREVRNNSHVVSSIERMNSILQKYVDAFLLRMFWDFSSYSQNPDAGEIKMRINLASKAFDPESSEHAILEIDLLVSLYKIINAEKDRKSDTIANIKNFMENEYTAQYKNFTFFSASIEEFLTNNEAIDQDESIRNWIDNISELYNAKKHMLNRKSTEKAIGFFLYLYNLSQGNLLQENNPDVYSMQEEDFESIKEWGRANKNYRSLIQDAEILFDNSKKLFDKTYAYELEFMEIMYVRLNVLKSINGMGKNAGKNRAASNNAQLKRWGRHWEQKLSDLSTFDNISDFKNYLIGKYEILSGEQDGKQEDQTRYTVSWNALPEKLKSLITHSFFEVFMHGRNPGKSLIDLAMEFETWADEQEIPTDIKEAVLDDILLIELYPGKNFGEKIDAQNIPYKFFEVSVGDGTFTGEKIALNEEQNWLASMPYSHRDGDHGIEMENHGYMPLQFRKMRMIGNNAERESRISGYVDRIFKIIQHRGKFGNLNKEEQRNFLIGIFSMGPERLFKWLEENRIGILEWPDDPSFLLSMYDYLSSSEGIITKSGTEMISNILDLNDAILSSNIFYGKNNFFSYFTLTHQNESYQITEIKIEKFRYLEFNPANLYGTLEGIAEAGKRLIKRDGKVDAFYFSKLFMEDKRLDENPGLAYEMGKIVARILGSTPVENSYYASYAFSYLAAHGEILEGFLSSSEWQAKEDNNLGDLAGTLFQDPQYFNGNHEALFAFNDFLYSKIEDGTSEYNIYSVERSFENRDFDFVFVETVPTLPMRDWVLPIEVNRSKHLGVSHALFLSAEPANVKLLANKLSESIRKNNSQLWSSYFYHLFLREKSPETLFNVIKYYLSKDDGATIWSELLADGNIATDSDRRNSNWQKKWDTVLLLKEVFGTKFNTVDYKQQWNSWIAYNTGDFSSYVEIALYSVKFDVFQGDFYSTLTYYSKQFTMALLEQSDRKISDNPVTRYFKRLDTRLLTFISIQDDSIRNGTWTGRVATYMTKEDDIIDISNNSVLKDVIVALYSSLLKEEWSEKIPTKRVYEQYVAFLLKLTDRYLKNDSIIAMNYFVDDLPKIIAQSIFQYNYFLFQSKDKKYSYVDFKQSINQLPLESMNNKDIDAHRKSMVAVATLGFVYPGKQEMNASVDYPNIGEDVEIAQILVNDWFDMTEEAQSIDERIILVRSFLRLDHILDYRGSQYLNSLITINNAPDSSADVWLSCLIRIWDSTGKKLVKESFNIMDLTFRKLDGISPEKEMRYYTMTADNKNADLTEVRLEMSAFIDKYETQVFTTLDAGIFMLNSLRRNPHSFTNSRGGEHPKHGNMIISDLYFYFVFINPESPLYKNLEEYSTPMLASLNTITRKSAGLIGNKKTYIEELLKYLRSGGGRDTIANIGYKYHYDNKISSDEIWEYNLQLLHYYDTHQDAPHAIAKERNKDISYPPFWHTGKFKRYTPPHEEEFDFCQFSTHYIEDGSGYIRRKKTILLRPTADMVSAMLEGGKRQEEFFFYYLVEKIAVNINNDKIDKVGNFPLFDYLIKRSKSVSSKHKKARLLLLASLCRITSASNWNMISESISNLYNSSTNLEFVRESMTSAALLMHKYRRGNAGVDNDSHNNNIVKKILVANKADIVNLFDSDRGFDLIPYSVDVIPDNIYRIIRKNLAVKEYW